MHKESSNQPIVNGSAVSDAKIPHFSKEQFSAAQKRLLLHQQSSLKFKASLSSAHEVTLSGDYSMGRISHNYFSKCIFDNASLHRAAGDGSIFNRTTFKCTDLSSATFQSSTFEECTFSACNLQHSNMSGCFFQGTVWTDCEHGPGNMSLSQFHNCTFVNTKPGNLAEAVLDNVSFENLRLCNLNLEFSNFKHIRSKNIVIAFSQLPYIFGGLDYILNTTDNVRISSHINKEDSISVEEYIEALHDMEVFYSYKREFFPLANILLAFQRYDEALAVILSGIYEAALQRDFRMCKYYCELIMSKGEFSVHTRQRIYNAIIQAAPIHSLTDAQRYQYLKHIPAIKSILVNNPDQFPSAVMRIQTQISFDDVEQISLLYTSLDYCLHTNGLLLSAPEITISHNSPIMFVINLCGAPVTILASCTLILSIISGVCKSYNAVAESILNTQDIKLKKQEIKLNEQKIRQGELEIQKLSREIKRLEKENPGLQKDLLDSRTKITKSGLIISHVAIEEMNFNPTKWS